MNKYKKERTSKAFRAARTFVPRNSQHLQIPIQAGKNYKVIVKAETIRELEGGYWVLVFHNSSKWDVFLTFTEVKKNGLIERVAKSKLQSS